MRIIEGNSEDRKRVWEEIVKLANSGVRRGVQEIYYSKNETNDMELREVADTEKEELY